MKYLLAIALLASSYSASAGCKINLGVKNVSNKLATVYTKGEHKSKVRNSGGSWRALSSGGWYNWQPVAYTDPGETASATYNATFGCNKKRRYKINYYCGKYESSRTRRTVYYPSASGWTKNTTIRVNLYCP